MLPSAARLSLILQSRSSSLLSSYFPETLQTRSKHAPKTPPSPRPPTDTSSATRKTDEYFNVIHHISTVVRGHDVHLERTLNKLYPSLQVNSELVYRILRACPSSGYESFRFFNWAVNYHPTYSPTSAEFAELLRTLARNRHWQTMWSVARNLHRRKLALDPEVVSFIIEEYGRAGLPSQAIEVFNKSPTCFACPQTTPIYNSLLFALCEVRDFYAAYALIRRMVRKGGSPDKKTYAVLVNAWCSAGKMREAQAFLEEMSRKGFRPPVRGRDLLIEGLLNAGYIESAKEMVKKITEHGALPDIRTFNSLLEAASNSGEVDPCMELYRCACASGLCPDINTYKVLIPLLSKVDRIDEALSLFHSSVADGHRPFPSLYAPIIKSLCRLGKFDDAFSFFSDMKIKGHPPNRPVYIMLITMCGRGGKFIQAANYLVEMTELNLMPLSRCFDMVTDGLKNAGKHDLAKKIEELEVYSRGV